MMPDEDRSGTHVRYTDKTYPPSGEKWLTDGEAPIWPTPVETVEALVELRFVMRGPLRILQQRCIVARAEGRSSSARYEWRDVPLVEESGL